MRTFGRNADDAPLDELRAALSGAGVPTPAMVAGAQAAWGWRVADARVATLIHDSLDDAPPPAGSAVPPRTLLFASAVLTVEVEVALEGLVGFVRPPAAGRVALLGAEAELDSSSVDDLGHFTLRRPRGGPVRLRCLTSDAVLTDWFDC